MPIDETLRRDALEEIRRLRRESESLKPEELGTRCRLHAAGTWKQADEFADAVLALGSSARAYPAALACLARSLYEGSIRTRWLAKDPSERLPRVLSHGAGDLLSWGADEAVAGELSQTAEAVVQRQRARGVCNDVADEASKGLPDLRQMAVDVGLGGDYIRVYKSLSWPAHWTSPMLQSHVANDSAELVPSIISMAACHYWMLVGDCATLTNVDRRLPSHPEAAWRCAYSRDSA